MFSKTLSTVFKESFFIFLFSWSSCTAHNHFELPKPTGWHAVGTKIFYMSDRKRTDPETGNFRQLVMQIWYPAEGKLREPSSPYAYEALKMWEVDLIKEGYEASTFVDQLGLIRTYAISDAPMCHDKPLYPIIIFGHGYGMPRGIYSILCEELASHGYIVCMVMHTYAAGITRFADGTETSHMRERSQELLSECAADVECMIDSLQTGVFTEVTKYCDFKNIGMVGHSLGGMITSSICRIDERIKAGISLDGPLLSSEEAKPILKPFMFLIAPTFYEMFSGENNFFSTNVDLFCQINGADSYKIVLKDSGHLSFSDCPIWVNFLKRILHEDDIHLESGKIDGRKAVKIVQTYIRSFFDKYLQGKTNRQLHGKDRPYVRDTEVSYWPG